MEVFFVSDRLEIAISNVCFHPCRRNKHLRQIGILQRGRGCYSDRGTRSFGGRYTKCKFELERIRSAVEAVASGLSFRKAANMYCISKSVLHRYSKLGIPVLMQKYTRNDSKYWNYHTPCSD